MTDPAPQIELTPEVLAEMRSVAEKATPGKWQALDAAMGRGLDWVIGIPSGNGYLGVATLHRHAQDGLARAEANAAYIAAFNPTAVLALLSELESSRRQRIVRAAIKYGQAVYSVPIPGRHGDVFRIMPASRQHVEPEDQGFLTSTGQFVDRTEALKIALAAKQPILRDIGLSELFSEDLW